MFSPVKQYAVEQGLTVYQPLKMKDGTALATVRELNPELIVVAAYGRILPEDILNTPKYGSINVHSSLLPKYRGAAPINWAILDGEKETGVSIMYMAPELDAGDVIRAAKTAIDPRGGRAGADGAARGARRAGAGRDGGGHRPRHGRAHAAGPHAVDLRADADARDERGRLDAPRPADPRSGARADPRGRVPCASWADRRSSCFPRASAARRRRHRGCVIGAGKQGIEVACGDGRVLRILELQAQGGRRMAAADYLRGHEIPVCL